jgi:hypothetical protein
MSAPSSGDRAASPTETELNAGRCPVKPTGVLRAMARKPAKRTEFVLFDVFYEDGSQRSNRRVPSEVLGGLDKDEPARAIIEEQDREIAEKSGVPQAAIKSIRRAGEKEKKRER